MVRIPRLLALALAGAGLIAMPASADPASGSACAAAIAAVEPNAGLPAGLLLGIALVETGRLVPGSGGVQPWPWSWNAGGMGYTAATKAEAVAAVTALRARGVTSIDVGCMQVNLHYHPTAFASVEDAFDPVANVRYAGVFLSRLRAGAPDWEVAIGRYHSGDPARGEAYQRRVSLAQFGQAWRGGTAPPVMQISLPPIGLCAPGARLVLVMRGTPPPGVRYRGARMVCLAPPRRR